MKGGCDLDWGSCQEVHYLRVSHIEFCLLDIITILDESPTADLSTLNSMVAVAFAVAIFVGTFGRNVERHRRQSATPT